MRRYALIILVFIFTFSAIFIYAKNPVNLKFSWWGGGERNFATLSVIQLYNHRNSNVKIEENYFISPNTYRKQIEEDLKNGLAADIIQFDVTWKLDFNADDYFLDLSNYSNILDLRGFNLKFMNDYCTFNEKLIGLPSGINSTICIVNKNLMKKIGIKQNFVWNWDNILEIGTKIHKNDKNVYLLVADVTHTIDLIKFYYLNKSGGLWINEDNTVGFNDKKILTDSFKYYLTLLDNGVIESIEDSILFDDRPEQNLKWINGNALMTLNWTSSIYSFKRPEFDIGVMTPSFAKSTKNTGIIVKPSQIFCINKNSPNKEEAVKFLNWLLNDSESIVKLGVTRSIPPNEKGRQILVENGLLEKNVSNAIILGILNAGKPENVIMYKPEIYNIFFDIVKKVGTRKISPEKAADELIKKTQEKLLEIKPKK